jgi:glycosyltransferase involved in cell wall biosynthesis
MPRVSVMIPTYNYARFLGEAIQSVLDQTFRDFEIIVVDDGSTDNTRDIVASFNDPRIRYIYQEHRGASAAQNVAIRAARGEYFTGLGADDVYYPENLELKVKLLDARPDIGMVSSNAYFFDDVTGTILSKLWYDPRGLYPDFDPVKAIQQPLKGLLRFGCVFLVQASLMRHQVLDEVCYFDEELPSSEDWDFVIRMVQHCRIDIIDIPLIKCRRHSTNLTKDPEKTYLGAVAFTNKVMNTISLSKDELKVLKDRLLPQHILYGRQALLEGREAEARKALIAAIKLAPWKIKLYAYVIASLSGNKAFLTLTSWIRKMQRRVLGRQTDKAISPVNGKHVQQQFADYENQSPGTHVRPKVSVVIATYNYGHFLSEAIQSVLDQTFKDFEIVVVNDGSTDNTKEIIDAYKDPRIRYIYQDHIGVSAAENAGLRAARGEYVTGLGADDLYLPENLEMKVKLLDSRPGVGIVYSDCYYFSDKTGAITNTLWRYPKGPHPWFDPAKATRDPLKELIHRGCFIMPQASMMRRQVFETVGYFDESLPTYEDWELIIRILQHFSAELIDKPLLKLRQHTTNLTKNPDKMYQGAVLAADKVIRSGTLTREQFNLLRKRLIPHHITYGRNALHTGREAATRRAMSAAIKLSPFNVKLYVYFILSFIGTKKIMALRNVRANLKRRLMGSQSSKSTSPVSG